MSEVMPNLPPMDGKINSNIVYDIPVEHIFADADFNVRGEIAPLDVVELSKDIKLRGLIQPITVQPWKGENGTKYIYRIIAGHRRYMAHLVAGLTHIRALVKIGLSDVDAISLNLIENLHRKELNKFQEAQAIKKLKMMGLTETECANKVGKSRGWAQVRYMILSLPDVVQEEIGKGTMSDEQIRECYALIGSEDQIEYVRKVKDAKLLGRRRPPKVYQKHVEKRPRKQEEMFELQDALRELWGNGIETMLLGWAAGITNDWELHRKIKEVADEKGIYYMIPHAYKTEPIAL